jgi:hypothetical protein
MARQRPPLTVAQIMARADAHQARTGQWPSLSSWAVVDAPGETWKGVNGCLDRGFRGLPGGGSLARLLDEHRGPRRRARKG